MVMMLMVAFATVDLGENHRLKFAMSVTKRGLDDEIPCVATTHTMEY